MYPCINEGCIALSGVPGGRCDAHTQSRDMQHGLWLYRLEATTQAADLEGPPRFPPTPWDDEPPFGE
jgi:hypothetical protein